MSEMRRPFQTLPAVVCRLAAKRALLVQETIKSGLARVCTFDRKTASANVKVEIEHRRSPGFVIRRATDRSLTFANLKHRKGVEYGRHPRTGDCAFQ
jgi:hypothetical protein